MDYEKKYNEALEQAKKELATCGSMDCDAARLIFRLFPQLRESEDERIRKWILEKVQGYADSGIPSPDEIQMANNALAYLEKQKDSKWSPSRDEMGVLYKLCYLSNQITDEDDTKLTRLYQDLKREYFNGHSFENMFPSEKRKEQKPYEPKNWPADKDALTQEQKPAEWSLEDDHIIGFVYDLLNEIEWKDSWAMSKDECLRLLKNYSPQKPAWSEEDEKMLDLIIGDFTDAKEILVSKDAKDFCDREIAWLKSIRPQPHTVSIKDATKFGNLEYERGVKDGIQSEKSRHWKPSEEQMNCLCATVDAAIRKHNESVNGYKPARVLKSLYEQLKKLM